LRGLISRVNYFVKNILNRLYVFLYMFGQHANHLWVASFGEFLPSSL